MNYVNYTSLERIPKLSASWYGDYALKNKYFGGRERFREGDTDGDEKTSQLIPTGEDFMLISLILIGSFSLITALLNKQTGSNERKREFSMYIELDQSIRGDSLKGEDHVITDANEFTIGDLENDEFEGEEELES